MKKVASNEFALTMFVLLMSALVTVSAATCRAFNPIIASTLLFGLLASAIFLAVKAFTDGVPFGTLTLSDCTHSNVRVTVKNGV
jgi:hypothetical protein